MKKQIFSKDFSSVCNANNSSLIVNKELLCWPFEQRAVSNDQRRIQNPIKDLIAFCGNIQRLRGVRLGKDVLYKEEEQQSRFFWNGAQLLLICFPEVLWILRNFQEQLFCRAPPVAASVLIYGIWRKPFGAYFNLEHVLLCIEILLCVIVRWHGNKMRKSWVWNCMLFQHFYWNLTHQVLFLYIFPSHHLNLREQSWRCTYFDAELTFVAESF